jgi:hypothetical protein
MHASWQKLALFAIIVFLFCRLFVIENLGLFVAGAAVLGLGLYAALVAQVA